ncbi:18824_t:CDS:2, partial [Racocetra persica]
FEKQILVKQSRFYQLKNNLLYKKNQKDLDKPIRVIKWNEVELVLYMIHSHPTAGHLETDAITKRHATTGYIPFQLVYGQQAILPIETTLPIEPQETDQEISLENSILQRAFELIDELLYQY